MVAARLPQGRRDLVVPADEGVHDTTAEGLAKLPAVRPDGVVMYGTQTHPADGAAGLILGREGFARGVGRDGVVRLLATGFARVEAARMPKAPVPAARAALDDAGLTMDDVTVIKTHNPVNDVWFARATGVDPFQMHPYGSSLVYGHPQAPTGARAIAELIAALHERGGGVGLFTGCTAGDVGAALVVRVDD